MIFSVGRSRACYDREETACICLPPGVAVSFLPQIKSCFFFFCFFFASESNLFIFLLLLLPAEAPQIAKQHFKQAPTSSENHERGPAWGCPERERRKERERGVRIVLINTSQNTGGIHVWACSAAYVDPAASFSGGFSEDAHWHIRNSPHRLGLLLAQSETFKNGSIRPDTHL